MAYRRWRPEGADGHVIAVVLGVAVTAMLLLAVVAPFYLLGHRFYPRLKRCEYGYEDFSLGHWEAWSSYFVSPVAAALLAYTLTRISGRRSLWPSLAVLVPLVVALLVFTARVGGNCGD